MPFPLSWKLWWFPSDLKTQLWQHNCMHHFKSLVVLEGAGNWAAFMRCISWKRVESFVQVISALPALSFIQQHQVLGSCHGFPPLFPITVQHLSQTGSDASKQATRNELGWKSVPSNFSCVCAITEPHHCQGCWGASSLFGRVQQHPSWQVIAFLSPFRIFRPLTHPSGGPCVLSPFQGLVLLQRLSKGL